MSSIRSMELRRNGLLRSAVAAMLFACLCAVYWRLTSSHIDLNVATEEVGGFLSDEQHQVVLAALLDVLSKHDSDSAIIVETTAALDGYASIYPTDPKMWGRSEEEQSLRMRYLQANRASRRLLIERMRSDLGDIGLRFITHDLLMSDGFGRDAASGEVRIYVSAPGIHNGKTAFVYVWADPYGCFTYRLIRSENRWSVINCDSPCIF